MRLIPTIKTLIKYAVLSKSLDDGKVYPVDQITSFGKTGYARLIVPYGMSVRAPEGTECVVLNVNGEEDNKVYIPISSAERFRLNGQGEIAYGSPKTLSVLQFNQDGSITINSNGDLNINLNGNKMTVDGDVDITGETRLGTEEGTLRPIARQGDSVQVGSDSGTITGGSSTQRASD